MVRRSRLIVGLGVAVLAGCGGTVADGYDQALRYPPRTDPVVVRPPTFEPAGLPAPGKLDASILALGVAGGELVLPGELSPGDLASLTVVVDELFGTPAAPTVPGPTDAGGFDLSPDTLAAGSRVYGRLCANCHGLTGNGRGPVGPWSYPYPRDFRTGAFKVAVGDSKPTLDQLVRQLRQGVPGTSMPVFDLLPEADVRAVSAYVVHLSRRGVAEAAGLRAAVDGDEPTAAVRRAAAADAERWNQPRPALPTVVAVESGETGYAEAVRRGKELFHSPTAGCAACHQDYGRTETYRYDVWGAPARVHDLTRGEFRWGRADATLAARVRHGIPAAGMPASPHLTDEQVRDLVTFVRDLGAPGRLPPDVRAEVYPQTATR